MAKLVRDRIPEIIKGSGREPQVYQAGREEFRERLRDKLVEESDEVLSADTPDAFVEELADLWEVSDAMLVEVGADSSARVGEATTPVRVTEGRLRGELLDQVREVLSASSADALVAELNRLMELTLDLAADVGVGAEELMAVTAKKAEQRGGFGQRLVLTGYVERTDSAPPA
nr:nucleoside triphosphate pyrophosphohydrolase [Streptomyces sp. NBC_00899]